MNYKPLRLLIACAILYLSPVAAQNESYDFLRNHTEISLGYGALSTFELNENAGHSGYGNFRQPFVDNPSISVRSSGTLQANIIRHLDEKLNIGLNFSHARYSTFWAFKDVEDVSLGNNIEFNNRYSTLSIRLQYNWKVMEKLQIYSAASLGALVIQSESQLKSFDLVSQTNILDIRSNTKTESTVQISPIGVRVGGQLAFFAEAGFGHQGIILAGLGYRFKGKFDR